MTNPSPKPGITRERVAQIRWAIKTLCDAAHHDRLVDLLNALECEIGARTFVYAAAIVGARMESERGAYSVAAHGRVAVDVLDRARRAVELTEWERGKILVSVREEA